MSKRVGIIGAGFVANFHLKALRSVRGVDVAAVFALKGAEELAATAREFGLGEPVVCSSVAELCQKVDAVAMFMPNYVRVDMTGEIVRAKQAGAAFTHVISEKPLARNLMEGRKMIEAVRGVGLKTMYFENQGYMDDLLALRAQLAPLQNRVGGFHVLRSAEEHGGPHMPWFWHAPLQGGGVLLDMGCHSVFVSIYLATPQGKPMSFLRPVEVFADLRCLKWAREPYVTELRNRWHDEAGKPIVDYSVTPAEDYATATLTLINPETDQEIVVVATDTWMFDKLGLRLSMECLGPGYAADEDTLRSPAEMFISDAAAAAVADAETMLEKAQSTRGLLKVLGNEPGSYGYIGEWRDAVAAMNEGGDGLFTWEDGFDTLRILMAGYMSAERKARIDLTCEETLEELDTFVPLIQQGRGKEVLVRS